MQITPLPLKDALLVESSRISDERGSFMRLFCAEALGLKKPIVQINHSVTHKKGAVRGLHYQRAPALEAKIVRCLRGRVLDVLVDLRQGSASFLQHCAVELSRANDRAVYIPEGFAHGFQALEADCELLYLHTAPYTKECEGGARHDEPRIGVVWPLPVAQLSARDAGFAPLGPDFKGLAV